MLPPWHLWALCSPDESKPCSAATSEGLLLLSRWEVEARRHEMTWLDHMGSQGEPGEERRSSQSWHGEGTLFLINKIIHIPDTKGCITVMNVCVHLCACR